ncbi:hypothetical protein ACXIUT_20875 [Achromobacter denitrificans]
MALSVMLAWAHSPTLLGQATWSVLMVTPVLAVHFIPALIRMLDRTARLGMGAIWVVSLLLVQLNHASFFLSGQHYMGDVRANAILVEQAVSSSVSTPRRSLTDIAGDVAKTKASLSKVASRPCVENCGWIKVQRDTLTARLEALIVEANEVRRWQAERDRQMVLAERERNRRDAARDDPVLASVSAWAGMTITQLGLITAVLFSVVLDVMAGLCWLSWSRKTTVTEPTITGPFMKTVTQPLLETLPGVTETAAMLATAAHDDPDILKVQSGLESGQVRLTVDSIRQYLRCSQEKARRIRRELRPAVQPPLSA